MSLEEWNFIQLFFLLSPLLGQVQKWAMRPPPILQEAPAATQQNIGMSILMESLKRKAILARLFHVAVAEVRAEVRLSTM